MPVSDPIRSSARAVSRAPRHRGPDAARSLAFVTLVLLGTTAPARAHHPFAAPDRNVTLLGSLDSYVQYSDVWGYTTSTGGEWALIGTLNGTSIIDATNPAAMSEVAFIPGPNSQWRDIKTWGRHAYIVTEGAGAGTGLQIVDLEPTPAGPPVLVRTYTTGFTTSHNLFIDESGFAYIVGTGAGMFILSLADPVNPLQVGFFGTYYVHDAYARAGTVYVSEMFRGHLEVLDATNKANLVPMGSITYPENFPHNVWLTDDGLHALGTDELAGGHLRAFDVSNPAAITQVGSYQRDEEQTIHNVTVLGDFAFISYYVYGLRVVDVSDPRFLSEVGGYDTFPGDGLLEHDALIYDGAWGVYPYAPSGNIYISDISTGLYVFSFTPDFGVVSGAVSEAGTGLSLAGADVHVVDGETVETLADGHYRVTSPPGPMQIEVTLFGFEDASVPATATTGVPVALDVSLTRLPSGTLGGFVTTASGALGLADAVVTVEGTPLGDLSAPGGAWDVGLVPEGFYPVRFERPGYVPQIRGVTIGAGAAVDLDVDLVPVLSRLDMESDPGWTVGAAGDNATSGIWVRVDPNGTSGGAIAPEDDATPDPRVLAWVTGNAAPGAGIGDNDVDGGTTTLTSAPIVFGAGDPPALLRYHRWYVNNGNSAVDDTFRVQISDDGGASWAPLETLAQTRVPWEPVDVDLAPYAAAGSVRLRFIAADLLAGSIVEAGVDEVSVFRTCQVAVNPFLPDGDADGDTDSCDACSLDPFDDHDGDGVCGDVDNAPTAANPGQADGDSDGVGDAIDNCVSIANLDQSDADGDGAGNACDTDDDDDGIADGLDPDADGDGVDDNLDLCPQQPDPSQFDIDSDGAGDACDDADGLVGRLRLDGAGRLTWSPEAGVDAYRVYRGALAAVGTGAVACLSPDRVVTAALDPYLPARGQGFYYIVGGVSGGLPLAPGRSSAGLRAIPACP